MNRFLSGFLDVARATGVLCCLGRHRWAYWGQATSTTVLFHCRDCQTWREP